MIPNVRFTVFPLLIVLISYMPSCTSRKDLSLTPVEYQKIGMPDHNKIWSNEDYLKSFTALSRIRINNPHGFPRKNSTKSGAIFSRMTDQNNLSYVNNPSMLLSDRAMMIMYFSGLLGDLGRLYTNELEKNEQFYDEEVIDICIFRLFVQGKMLELAEQIMNSDEPSSISLRSGKQTVVIGYLNLIKSSLQMQLQSAVYRIIDLERLSQEITGSLKNNLAYLEPSSKQQIILEVMHVIEKSPSKNIKKNYQELLQVLQDTR